MEEKKNITIEYHADDYGLFPTQSHRILDCHRNGNLNGISVFPNSPHLSECMSDMHLFSEEVAVTVHLNLIEGKSLCSVPQQQRSEGAVQPPLFVRQQRNLTETFSLDQIQMHRNRHFF